MNDEEELERQRELSVVRDAMFDDNIEVRFAPGSFGYHELLDRTSIMMDNWESFAATHPATLLDRERFNRAREIHEAMIDFYRLVGSVVPE